jgi:hypothetical protein
VNTAVTYRAIQECVKRKAGFTPKTCWIAHVKELNGLPLKSAPNRQASEVRQYPCPPDKRGSIEDCLRHFKMF